MAGNKPNTEGDDTAKQAEPAAQPSQPDPLLVLQQQNKAKYEELSKTMVSLNQQRSIMEDMTENTKIQMAEVRGAIQTIERVRNIKNGDGT